MKQAKYHGKKFHIRHLPSLIKDTVISWDKDDPWRLSAIVAYYAILSLPGLLVVIFYMLTYFWGPDIVEGQIYVEIEEAMGTSAAQTMQSIFEDALEAEGSIISTIIGLGALLFGATGVFYHLQISLNKVWEVKSVPKQGMLRYLIDRARSFGFVLVIGFLLLISFIISILLSALQDYIGVWLPELSLYLIQIANIIISLAVITILFALIFKYLPDIIIGWKNVWFGAFIASFLFAIGKEVLTIYFREANPGSVYGAAGSIIIILLWVTYSCLILLFGAEFTWVYTKRYGYRIEPKSHARFINKYGFDPVPESREKGGSEQSGSSG
jgi:membrane protein